jgi:hypothetical protein
VSADRAEAIADFVDAKRVRKELLSICNEWLENNPLPNKEKVPANAINDYLIAGVG